MTSWRWLSWSILLFLSSTTYNVLEVVVLVYLAFPLPTSSSLFAHSSFLTMARALLALAILAVIVVAQVCDLFSQKSPQIIFVAIVVGWCR